LRWIRRSSVGRKLRPACFLSFLAIFDILAPCW
jgi:hypothetical protein